MNVINKQKFLAELGRLLTFMYEEDRQTALEMYNDMFDSADDEQALIQFLVSPTRQAVLLARRYDAKERKLQVHSQSRDAAVDPGSGAVSDFVVAINNLRQEAVNHDAVTLEDKDQLSLFDQSAEDDRSPAAAEDAAPVLPESDSEALPFYGDAGDAAAPQEALPQPEEAAPRYAPPVEEDPAEEADQAESTHEQIVIDEQETIDGQELIVESEAETEEGPEPPAEDGDEPAADEAAPDSVDAFLADFSITNSELIPAPAEEPELYETEYEAQPELEAAAEPEPLLYGNIPTPSKAELPVFDEDEALTQRKPRVFLLILFILLAVPITLIGIAVLLVPTLLFLALAASVFSLGGVILSSAFSGFAVLADIMVVLGVALIVLALGILFAWIFVWFIGGAITGLIRSVIRLGGRWCYKEVPVE